jgi:integrase
MFLERAPAHLHLALMLALWTGQRQGDLLRLPWSAYDGTHIRLRQPKGGVRVQIRVGAPLKAALDAAPRRCTIILTSATGKPWTSGGFQQAWRTACKAAGITGVTFHDLRGTAATWIMQGIDGRDQRDATRLDFCRPADQSIQAVDLRVLSFWQSSV